MDVYLGGNISFKTIHHTVNITFTEVELFAIRYGIEQAVQVLETIYICVVTNASHSAKGFLIYQSILINYN